MRAIFHRAAPRRPRCPISHQLPFRAASGPCGRWQHVWGAGWRYREIISGNPTGRGPNFRKKSTDYSAVSAISLLPSASAIFRRRPFPVASGPCVRWELGWGQDDDIGGPYLENQQALGQICGDNRPTLVLLLPFSVSAIFRLIPSASAISRRHPFRVASGPFF